MHPSTVLIADSDPVLRAQLRQRLGRGGSVIEEAGTAAEALLRVNAAIDVVVLDAGLLAGTEINAFSQLSAVAPEALIILLTPPALPDVAAGIGIAGAHGSLPRPFDLDGLDTMVPHALETVRLRREVRRLRGRARRRRGFDSLVGSSSAMLALKSLLARAARNTEPAILAGEPGTGKDQAARAIHVESDRARGPFIPVHCSESPEARLEAELFGEERHAATGVHTIRRGLFEIAAGGTIYLDGIGALAPSLQARLLRVVDEKVCRRVGGTEDVVLDVRIIAATRHQLDSAVDTGTLRRDLLYRLMPIHVPPLRARAGDIGVLAHHYVSRYNSELRKRVRGLTPEAAASLAHYAWPANVRELRNAIERAMLLLDGGWITPELLRLTAP
jgi:DNA-binding NtrC family response regulator